MSAKKKSIKAFVLLLATCIPLVAIATTYRQTTPSEQTATQLGWVIDPTAYCGGYYIEQPFIPLADATNEDAVGITGNQGLLAQRGTSILEDQVTITRRDQEITANKAYLYRDPVTFKLTSAELLGNIHLREPNTLIIAKQGRYTFDTKAKSLIDILYRTSLFEKQADSAKTPLPDIHQVHKITKLTAWGKAYEFSQTEPNVYEFSKASFSTCPPLHPAWRVKSSHMVLNKNTGRGYATHSRLYVKGIPVLYMPYINFPIDNRRKSGFLWPTIGASNRWGPYVLTPYYWNMAPNYDMTITPGILTKSGFRLVDDFRYLTEHHTGDLNFSILPNDRFFADFQRATRTTPKFSASTNPVTQAEFNRLMSDSTTRKGLFWRNDSHLDDYWSSHIDFNYAGDDYYLRDFGNNLNQITQNQLLQEGDLFYKGPNWNFTGRVQAYQTLHPIDEFNVQNQYRRLPQLILDGDYPEQAFGLQYFINNEVTHFDILNTPGTSINLPIGNRLHTQPGVALPMYWPYFYINPRLQMDLTEYELYQTADTQTPPIKKRALPIFHIIASGASFGRDATLFGHLFQQTLEPQVYYTYIPYRNQASIPIFDTTINTLTYDQLFNYNRFTGLDRIGDANQIGVGVTTRLIDQESGLEKVHLGVGEIVYFANRLVTLCNNNSCTDNPDNHANYQRLSPLSGVLDYHVNALWQFTGNVIWNPTTKQMNNTTLGLHYKPDEFHIINLGYSYAHSGNPLSGISTNNTSDNLKVTDISAVWPVFRDISGLGRWSQNWNQGHLQNLLYGLQYDTCCWAVRLVGGRAFTGLDPNNNNRPTYTSEFYVQFSLKGLGNIDSGNPGGLLHNISGYNPQFR